MAVTKFGTIVTDIKGKVQGQVFQLGNISTILRNKGLTRRANSQRFYTSKARLSQLSSAWRSLTETQRNLWIDIAPNWPFTDKFGNTYTGSGYQVYMAFNKNLLTMSLPTVDVPGTPVTPTNPEVFSVDVDTDGDVEIGMDGELAADEALLVFLGKPVSAGRNGNNIPKRFAVSVPEAANPVSIPSSYAGVWYAPAIGQKCVVSLSVRNFDWPYDYFRTQWVVLVDS